MTEPPTSTLPRDPDSILLEIRKRLAERLEIPLEEVPPDAHVFEDLEAESIDLLVLISDLEQDHGIQIEDTELTALSTPRDFAAYLETKLP